MRTVLLCFLLLLLPAGSAASTGEGFPLPETTDERSELAFPSGMRILLIRDSSRPLVSVTSVLELDPQRLSALQSQSLMAAQSWLGRERIQGAGPVESELLAWGSQQEVMLREEQLVHRLSGPSPALSTLLELAWDRWQWTPQTSPADASAAPAPWGGEDPIWLQSWRALFPAAHPYHKLLGPGEALRDGQEESLSALQELWHPAGLTIIVQSDQPLSSLRQLVLKTLPPALVRGPDQTGELTLMEHPPRVGELQRPQWRDRSPEPPPLSATDALQGSPLPEGISQADGPWLTLSWRLPGAFREDEALYAAPAEWMERGLRALYEQHSLKPEVRCQFRPARLASALICKLRVDDGEALAWLEQVERSWSERLASAPESRKEIWRSGLRRRSGELLLQSEAAAHGRLSDGVYPSLLLHLRGWSRIDEAWNGQLVAAVPEELPAWMQSWLAFDLAQPMLFPRSDEAPRALPLTAAGSPAPLQLEASSLSLAEVREQRLPSGLALRMIHSSSIPLIHLRWSVPLPTERGPSWTSYLRERLEDLWLKTELEVPGEIQLRLSGEHLSLEGWARSTDAQQLSWKMQELLLRLSESSGSRKELRQWLRQGQAAPPIATESEEMRASRAALEAMKQPELEEAWRAVFHPRRARLLAAGPLGEDSALGEILGDAWRGWGEDLPRLQQRPEPLPADSQRSRLLLLEPDQDLTLRLSCRLGPGGAESIPARALLSWWLQEELGRETALTLSERQGQGGRLQLLEQTSPAAALARSEEWLELLTRARRGVIDPAELERGKAVLLRALYAGSGSSRELLDRHQESFLQGASRADLEQHPSRLLGLTVDDLSAQMRSCHEQETLSLSGGEGELEESLEAGSREGWERSAPSLRDPR